MPEIKRFNVFDISEKFGLNFESEDFVFKPQNITPNHHSEPHRSEMYGIGMVLDGRAELKVGLDSYAVQSPGLVAVRPDQIRQWIINQDKLTFTGLFFTENFVISGLSDALFLKKLSLFRRNERPFIPLNPEDLASIHTLFNQIEKKNASDSPLKNVVLRALIITLLLEVESILQPQETTPSDKYSQSFLLTGRFKDLLEKNFSEQREVAYYAENIYVTPKYLTQVLKDQTGKTASELIDEMVCLEAKVLLQINRLTVSQIADQLHFSNPSFFGKFFKRQTGMSPVEYRKSLY